MKKVVFHIDSDREQSEVSLVNEMSFGRTDAADVVLPDSGLSRVNTTFFRDGDQVFAVDENSLNGTFVNGEQIFGRPHPLNDRDEIVMGSNTRICVEIFAEKPVSVETKSSKTSPKAEKKPEHPPQPSENKPLPLMPILAGLFAFVIIFGAVIAIFIASAASDPNGKPTPAAIQSDSLVPVRVHDPLGGVDPEDINDLIAILDNDIADQTVADTDLQDLQNTMETSTIAADDKTAAELIVKPEFFNQMINLAKEPRSPSGERPPGLNVLRELCCGVPKQTAKLDQMVRKHNYTQPLDYADLAERRLNGQLLELPVATQDYVLDVGGNANTDEFNEFSWDTNPRTIPLSRDAPKYKILQRLAENFGGQKYDLDNPSHRKQMKIRLLRMFNPRAKPILEEFAKSYRQKFNRPLRITSLTRSMEYQISLNGNNANSFKVRGDGSRPPHTSGCAFDLARKQMTTEEQNFMIQTLAAMENRGILDALVEFHTNACFHIFIYDDGKPPG